MGGLVCRYFLEVLRMASHAKAHQHRHAVSRSLNALGFISNGMIKRLGPINIVDLTQLLRSFTSVYQLLPIYPCYDAGDGSLQRVLKQTAFRTLTRYGLVRHCNSIGRSRAQ